MSRSIFRIKIIKRDPKQIGFDFQKKIESDKEKVFIRKEAPKSIVTEIKKVEQIREPREKRIFDYINTPSLHNYSVSIQEDIDMGDVEFIKYVVNRVNQEFKEEIINSVLYEHKNSKLDRYLCKDKSEIKDRISSIYCEIEKYQEVTLDDIRELLLLFSKEDIEFIADSIDELEEDFSETLDNENEDEKE